MEILFDNPLARMYGPYFLILFGFIIFFAVIILALVKMQFDKTDRYPVPAVPTNPDPYQIAYLRGGTNEVARSVIFSLMQKGFIKIDNSGKKPLILKTDIRIDPRGVNQTELTALGWLGYSREPKEFFGADGLNKRLEFQGNIYQNQLEQRLMLTDETARSTMNPAKWSVYLLIFLFGAYKLFAAVHHGNFNVIFLVILTALGLIISKKVAELPRLTKLGKAYLNRLQTAFDNLKYTSQAAYIVSNQGRVAPQTTFTGVDPLLLSVGVFGGGILAGTIFDSYNQAFQKANNALSSSSSSCGSSCGSCSSGSSCSSGGSSCGGGCGGCGG